MPTIGRSSSGRKRASRKRLARLNPKAPAPVKALLSYDAKILTFLEEYMSVKPSGPEEEYFARLEAERRRKVAAERQAEMQEEERQRQRTLHFMKCPKCGMQLEEIAFGDVRVDKCFHCEGMWLDKGELESIHTKEPGFMGKLLNVFRS